MDHVALSTQNRLFWLGRYSERVYTTIQFMLEKYDKMLDDQDVDYPSFCRRIGVPVIIPMQKIFAADICLILRRRYPWRAI